MELLVVSHTSLLQMSSDDLKFSLCILGNTESGTLSNFQTFQSFVFDITGYPMDMETSFVRDFARDMKRYLCNNLDHVLLQEIGCNISVEEITPKLFKSFQDILRFFIKHDLGFKIVHTI